MRLLLQKKDTSGGTATPVNARTMPRIQQMYGQQPPSYYPPAQPALPPMQPKSSGPKDNNAFLALAAEDSQGTQSYRQQPAYWVPMQEQEPKN